MAAACTIIMRVLLAILIMLTLISAPVVQCTAEEAKRPMVLLFDASAGEGADKRLAAAATKAIRSYLRDTRRVDTMVFDRESPTVLRAIMDKRLTADNVASYSSRAERIEVAKVMVFQYAAGAEITIKNDNVEVRLWVANVAGGKKSTWETTGSAAVGGTGNSDSDNAMQCAASAAVIEMARQAFVNLVPIKESEPSSGNETTAITVDQMPTPPTATEYSSQAESSINDGNLAVAIQQYTQAVNADPSNGVLRIKLAEAYARKGLYDDANSELGQALMVGADKALVDEAKLRIEAMRNGQTAQGSETKSNTEPGASTTLKTEGSDTTDVKANPVGSVGKMMEGDKLWNAGKPDEAAEAYREAIKLNPSDWHTYERLAVVNAALALFNESRKALMLLAKVQPSPSPETLQVRYDLLRKAFDRHFTSLLRQYDTDISEFTSRKITRESYYNSVKGHALRLESMSQLLDVIAVPPAKQSANLHRGLAFGLMAQAASSMLDYLETNNEKSKANAEVFANQARKEIETAAAMETTVSVETADATKP